MNIRHSLSAALLLLLVAPTFAAERITVDAAADRHAIDPRIYGVAFATEAQLSELNVPLNRWGGNTASRYNWKLDCDNKGSDWFFQSIAAAKGPLVAGAAADAFIARTQAGGAVPMMTVPLLDWMAKVGEDRNRKLWSYSRGKYGNQQRYDQWNPDSGNGLKADGKTRFADFPRSKAVALDLGEEIMVSLCCDGARRQSASSGCVQLATDCQSCR